MTLRFVLPNKLFGLGFLIAIHGCAASPQVATPPKDTRSPKETVDAHSPRVIDVANDIDLSALRWIDWEDGILPTYPAGGDRNPPLQIEMRTQRDVEYVVKMFENETVCTKKYAPRSSGYITFRPGTATPTGYAGELGQCAKEPKLSGDWRDLDAVCEFRRDSTLDLQGYAWPFEATDAQESRRLSEKRLEVIENRLEQGALPTDVRRAEAQGWKRTQVRGDQGNHVMGVSFRASGWPPYRTVPRPEFFHGSGPPLPSGIRSNLRRRFKEGAYITGRPSESPKGYWLTVRLRLPEADEEDAIRTYRAVFYKLDFQDHPIVKWTKGLVDTNCDVTIVGRTWL